MEVLSAAAGKPVEMPSERSFGLVWTTVFALVGCWPWFSGGAPRVWSLGVAALLLLITLVHPQWLRIGNRGWFWLGQRLHNVMTPLLMGVIFFGVITPMALLRRGLGKDSLDQRFDPGAATYWKPRQPPGPAPESLKHQF